jgi:hypothetical protein
LKQTTFYEYYRSGSIGPIPGIQYTKVFDWPKYGNTNQVYYKTLWEQLVEFDQRTERLFIGLPGHGGWRMEAGGSDMWHFYVSNEAIRRMGIASFSC